MFHLEGTTFRRRGSISIGGVWLLQLEERVHLGRSRRGLFQLEEGVHFNRRRLATSTGGGGAFGQE